MENSFLDNCEVKYHTLLHIRVKRFEQLSGLDTAYIITCIYIFILLLVKINYILVTGLAEWSRSR